MENGAVVVEMECRETAIHADNMPARVFHSRLVGPHPWGEGVIDDIDVKLNHPLELGARYRVTIEPVSEGSAEEAGR